MIMKNAVLCVLALWGLIGGIGAVGDAAGAEAKQAKRIMPDRLALGTVRVGAIAEASVRVEWQTRDVGDGKLKATAPSFLVVEETGTHPPQDTRLDSTTYSEVVVSFQTTRAGDFSDKLKLEFGNHQAEIPVSIEVLPKKPGLTKVLIVETPFEMYSTEDASVFDPLLEIVKSAELDVNYARNIPKRFSQFDVFLLAESGLLSLDKTAPFKEFVDNGGRLILCANAFYRGTVAKANEILEDYGLRMDDREPRSELTDLEIKDEVNITKDVLTEGVKSVTVFRPSPIRIIDRSKAKALVRTPFYYDEGFVAVSRDKGEVVALGQSLWWSWAGRDQSPGNRQLLINLLSKRRPEK